MQRVLLFALFCLAVNCQVVLHLTTRTDQFYFGSLICLGYGQSNVTINYFNIPVKTVIKMNPVISSNQTVCDTDLEYSTAITCGTANVEVTISPANSTSGYPWTATFAGEIVTSTFAVPHVIAETISPANSTSGYPWTATFAFSE